VQTADGAPILPRQASLTGAWNKVVKAASGGDFPLMDAFPRNVFIDGVRPPASHRRVSRMAAAVRDSDQTFEDLRIRRVQHESHAMQIL